MKAFDGISEHYCAGHFEAIDIIEAYNLNFSLGNAVKYILRCGRKGDDIDALRDLEKAEAYIRHEIDRRRKTVATDSSDTDGLTRLARRECDY